MNGHRGTAPVGMAHDVVAARDPRDLEARLNARTTRSPRTEGTGGIRPRRL
jgi:hypothetical protein